MTDPRYTDPEKESADVKFEQRLEDSAYSPQDRIDLNAISLTIAFEILNDSEAVVLDVLLERVR